MAAQRFSAGGLPLDRLPPTGPGSPEIGVIFGFAFGTIGYAIDLPSDHLAAAERTGLTTRRDPHDFGSIGPRWRFGKWLADEIPWCRAAYDDVSQCSTSSQVL